MKRFATILLSLILIFTIPGCEDSADKSSSGLQDTTGDSSLNNGQAGAVDECVDDFTVPVSVAGDHTGLRAL